MKTEKQRIVYFDGKCRAGYMGMGMRRPKYFTIYYRSTRSLQGSMRICQGNLREFSGKNCPTFIAINQLAVKLTRRNLSFGCICINSSTCYNITFDNLHGVKNIPHDNVVSINSHLLDQKRGRGHTHITVKNKIRHSSAQKPKINTHLMQNVEVWL